MYKTVTSYAKSLGYIYNNLSKNQKLAIKIKYKNQLPVLDLFPEPPSNPVPFESITIHSNRRFNV